LFHPLVVNGSSCLFTYNANHVARDSLGCRGSEATSTTAGFTGSKKQSEAALFDVRCNPLLGECPMHSILTIWIFCPPSTLTENIYCISPRCGDYYRVTVLTSRATRPGTICRAVVLKVHILRFV
ncbi:MAG: hypothetical protein LWX54_15270, partial [Deltaproteobacteria bacterium]|nr:hypothetical protein [Deltaproteobacteria bacterium]